MAKTALLAQNDDLVIENLKAHVGKSVFDLSHSVTFPIDVDGAILPICCVETVPSDSFEISVECLLRQLSPLKVPLMTNLRLNIAFYYCDNRLAWKKWERFMTGGRSGNELYDIPRCANFLIGENKSDLIDFRNPATVTSSTVYKGHNYKNTLHTYFGISLNHSIESNPSGSTYIDSSDELPIAFPFFDYQMICRDYYTNVDRLPDEPLSQSNFYDFDSLDSDWAYSNLFPSDDDEIRLLDGIQVKSGFQSGDDSVGGTKGFILDKVRYHDVRPDYFTTSNKAPMRGTPPALSAQSKLTLPSGTKLTITNENGVIYEAWDSDGHGAGQNAYVGTSDGAPVGTDLNPLFTIANSKNVQLGANAEHSDRKIKTDLSGVKAIDGETKGDLELVGLLQANWTAADIRLLSQLSVWQELNMLHDPYYDDFLNAHFDNVRVGESTVEKPQYIGGTSQLISINEILQTSQTTETSPLGNQGATAMSLASNFVGRYYCNNYGFIIGVCYIMPEMLYKPAKPRWSSRETKEDYYSPEFANLSMQATLNKEIFFSDDDDWNNTPWGYTGAFDELRSIPNRVAGDLLNPSYETDLGHWVLTRNMSNENKPAMIHNWLSLKDNVDDTAWQHQSMPKFMLQCANYIKAVRPMPKIAIPKAL